MKRTTVFRSLTVFLTPWPAWAWIGPSVSWPLNRCSSKRTLSLYQVTSAAAATVMPQAPSASHLKGNNTTIIHDEWIQNNLMETLSKNHDVPKVFSQSDKVSGSAKGFPFGFMVGMDEIKQAMILAATNSRIGGVILSGRRGSGKSVAARAVRRLLPHSIQRVRNSPYNIDPNGNEGIDSILQRQLIEKGKTLQDMETETIPTPFVDVPLNVMEDSLLGSIDLERSLESGQTIFFPGLLARAHRGVLYVDEINLLDEETVNFLLTVLADGFVRIEREGLSVVYPCRPRVFLATYNPVEGELREHLLDRIGLSLVTNDLTLEERVEATELVLGYTGDPQFQITTLEQFKNTEAEEQELRDTIENARQRLGQVQMSQSQILYICQEATRAGCEGQRAEIFATEVARTSAALAGRTNVNAKDLQIAVLLAIAPRATILPQDYLEDSTSDGQAQQQPPTSPSPLQPMQEVPPPQEEPTAETSEEDEEQPDDEEDENEEELEEIEIPLEFMFGVTETPIDPRLMYFNRWTRKGKGRKGSRRFNLERGRFIKAIFPKTRKGKLAVAATLRAAAPYQKIRRKHNPDKQKLVFVTKDDFRIKRMAKKAGTLIVFVVDASGSMALNRMDAAKGAALSLLSEAYKSRDKICLIACHGKSAKVLVPPTKSMALARNRLESMPCGGLSPLSHGLLLATRTGLNAIKVKQDIGRVVIVLLSDGRLNIPVCVSEGDDFEASVDPNSKNGEPSRTFLKDEAIVIAKRLGSLDDFNLLCIDTEDKFVGTGIAREIARCARGNYVQITHPGYQQVAQIAKQGVEAAKRAA